MANIYDGLKEKLLGALNSDKTEGEAAQLLKDRMEKKKVDEVESAFMEAKTSKQEIAEAWKRFVKMWRGDHWNRGRAKWKAKSVENLAMSSVESQLPLMTDRQPEILVYPQTPHDEEIAVQLNSVISHRWNADDMDEKLVETIRDSLIIGTGIQKVFWDNDLYNGLGDVTAQTVDPFDIFPDPEATSPKELEWLIYRYRMSPKKAKRVFGVEVPSDRNYTDELERNTQTRMYQSPRTNSCTILEYYYRDEETGQLKMRITSNGKLLREYEEFERNEFPFIFYYDMKLKSEFWGLGEIATVEILQQELNKTRALVMDNMIKAGNQVWVIDRNSGVKKHLIDNTPGAVIEKTPGSQVDRLQVPGLPSYIPNQIEQIKRAFQDVTGSTDVSRGMISGSVTAASAIQSLQEASQTRVRGKLRNVEFAVKELGKWYIAMFREHYDTPRFYRLIKDGNVHFETFDPQGLKPNIPKLDPVTGQQEIDPVTGHPLFEQGITDFDIQIKSGSSMMLNKSARFEQAFEMYKNNALDIETLLNLSEMGETKDIVKRLIDYGALKDPKAEKINLGQALADSGIRFNMNTSDPLMVKEALDKVQQVVDQYNQSAEQVGAPQVNEGNSTQAVPQLMAGLPPELGQENTPVPPSFTP